MGSKVLLKDFTRKKRKGGKLDMKWTGPYLVKKHVGKGIYLLSSPNNPALKIKRASGCHLKPYRTPPASPVKSSNESSRIQLSIADSSAVTSSPHTSIQLQCSVPETSHIQSSVVDSYDTQLSPDDISGHHLPSNDFSGLQSSVNVSSHIQSFEVDLSDLQLLSDDISGRCLPSNNFSCLQSSVNKPSLIVLSSDEDIMELSSDNGQVQVYYNIISILGFSLISQDEQKQCRRKKLSKINMGLFHSLVTP